MTEQELRQELEIEYQVKYEEACADMEEEMQEVLKSVDDFKDKTNKKVTNYRLLSNKLYSLRKNKKLADFKYTEAVESILMQMYNLENKDYTSPFVGAYKSDTFVGNDESYCKKPKNDLTSYGIDSCDTECYGNDTVYPNDGYNIGADMSLEKAPMTSTWNEASYVTKAPPLSACWSDWNDKNGKLIGSIYDEKHNNEECCGTDTATKGSDS